MSVNPYELKALRCVKCGAPLSEPPSQSEYINCEFCGYTQKLIDSREYLDKLRSEVYNWVKSIVPPAAAVSQIVDPMARHNIFVFNIKPKILGEYASVKSRLSTHLIHPLFILPFFQPASVRPENPRACFENLAKVQSLEQMAVVDEDKNFMDDVVIAYEVYAHTANAFELTQSKSDLSFLINNFDQIATSLEKHPQRTVEYKRMCGVVKAFRATDQFLKGDLSAAKQSALGAIQLLEEVAKEARKSTSTAVMIPATTQEISSLRTLGNLVEAGLRLFEAGRFPSELLPYLHKYFSLAEQLRTRRGANTSIYEELSAHLRNIVEAKIGASQIQTLQGSGNLLVPLWIVSLNYTFATGTLLWKKGKEVEDMLLVAATMPLASQPVTDVFGRSAGLMDQLSGKETTLSTGFIGNIVAQARKTSLPSSTKVIPPLSTKEDSERTAEAYLSAVSRSLGGKIRFGAAHSLGLVYAPTERQGSDVYAPSLGYSQIKLAPYLEQLIEIAL
ncbi:MAG TPA: hypothetical protein VJ249_01020 [Candidatus Bathyarchaeia archaeon]|nr:hypothetical protein [Candidatus Bathyarchaeia archaeon]